MFRGGVSQGTRLRRVQAVNKAGLSSAAAAIEVVVPRSPGETGQLDAE
jgi:hypothetical protein